MPTTIDPDAVAAMAVRSKSLVVQRIGHRTEPSSDHAPAVCQNEVIAYPTQPYVKSRRKSVPFSASPIPTAFMANPPQPGRQESEESARRSSPRK